MANTTRTRREAVTSNTLLARLTSLSLESRLLIGICLVGLVLRLWPIAGFSIEYDEGVYWQSLRALAGGHALFSSVFSSQPPAFLLALYPLYLLFGQSLIAARLGVVVFSLAGIVALYIAGRAAAGKWAGIAAALLLALDPLYLAESHTLQAEVPALAWEAICLAFAVTAYRAAGSRQRRLAAASGIALGLGILTKLLDVVVVIPVMLYLAHPVFASFLSKDGRVQRPDRPTFVARLREIAMPLALCAAGAIVAVVVVLLPFAGHWRTLYDQVVTFHLAAARVVNEGFRHNVTIIWQALSPDPLVWLALVGFGVALWRRDWRAAPPLLWAVASCALLLRQHPLFAHHVVLLVPPLALLAGVSLLGGERVYLPIRAGRPSMAMAPVGAVALCALVLVFVSSASAAAAAKLIPSDVAGMAAAVRAASLPDDYIASDDQYIVGVADRNVPPQLVDTSIIRVTSGYLTASQLETVLTGADVRVLLFASGRFDHVPGFVSWVQDHYVKVADFGNGRALYVRAPHGTAPA